MIHIKVDIVEKDYCKHNNKLRTKYILSNGDEIIDDSSKWTESGHLVSEEYNEYAPVYDHSCGYGYEQRNADYLYFNLL